MKINFTLPIVFFFVSSCTLSSDPQPLFSPGFDTPRVYGIYLTGASGPDVIGVWGSPSETTKIFLSGIDKPVIRFIHPYPNPSNGSLRIEIEIAATSIVDIWVTKALGPNEIGDNLISSSTGLTFVKGGIIVDTLTTNWEMKSGLYAYVWSIELNENNIDAGSGFYRIYLRSWDEIIWVDALLLFDPCAIRNQLLVRSIGGSYSSNCR